MYNLDHLKEYNESTTDNGILMPTIEDFDNKVKLATSLWPQVKNGKIEYLFGKGVGVELALRGIVLNRKKNNNNFSYRSHSDFEIYDSYSDKYDELDNSKSFKYVFGAQEIYTKNKTKALSDIPEGLMDNTYDVVEYNGQRYLIPELEILFLDKFLRKESTPRSEGLDSKLLMMEYNMDLDKIINYFKRFFLEPNMKQYDEYIKNAYYSQLEGFNKKLLDFVTMLLEEDGYEVNLKNINGLSNEIITHELSLAPHYGYGINFSACPSQIEYIDNNGVIEISDTSKEQIMVLIDKMRKDKINYFNSLCKEIINMYNSIYTDVKKM